MVAGWENANTKQPKRRTSKGYVLCSLVRGSKSVEAGSEIRAPVPGWRIARCAMRNRRSWVAFNLAFFVVSRLLILKRRCIVSETRLRTVSLEMKSK